MLGVRCVGKRKGRMPMRQESKGDLTRGRAMRIGDFLQHEAAGRSWAGKLAMTERGVADDGDAVALAPGDNGMFAGALLQILNVLVAGEILRRDRPRLVEVGDIEVAHAPGQDVSGAPQLFECRDRVLPGLWAAPLQA